MSLSRYGLLLLSVLWLAGAGRAQEATPTAFPPAAYAEASVADIDLLALPVLPELTDHARRIYERGQAAGQNARTFAKVGDCMTDADYYLYPFGQAAYDLGDFADLEPLIAFYLEGNTRPEADAAVNPFVTNSLAAESGYNTASILDPIWSDPTLCTASESPLACEYRLSRPAFAFIMVGTNDVQFFDAASFDRYARQIVQESILSEVVPVLFTFPVRPEFPENTVLFNQIIVSIAREYDLPLINLYRALYDLPDQGVDRAEPTHVTLAADGQAGLLTDAYLQTGATQRNLLTLQALAIFQAALATPATTPGG
ncbi:MAG: SGNH/GDSL hydrolase family protein [Anaerolineae bacterium]|nr:SGNH/GDSL hydrolase family protein [Anaerolineae bacterium]